MCEEGRERVPPSWMSPGVRRRGSAWPRAWRQGPVLAPSRSPSSFPRSQQLWRCRDAVWWLGRAGETLGEVFCEFLPRSSQVLSQHVVRKEGDPTTGPVSPCGP